MNLAVAYRFNGEDPAIVTSELRLVCESLRAAGHDVFCAREHEILFREQGWANDDIYAWCLERFRSREAVLVFLRSDARSRGIELELADAQRRDAPVILVTPRDVRLYREHAQQVIEYEDISDAREKLCALEVRVVAR